MLITIIAWIYITFLSYSWGKLFLNFVSKRLKLNQTNNFHPSISCFTGLTVIATLASILSFFLPLGIWPIQLLFALPAILNYKNIFAEANKFKTSWLIISTILFACCIAIVLIISTFTISHPDTLGYHIQIIKWIEDYKIVPGIANLNARLGFQSSWFISCALFSFNFTSSGSYVYLNSLIILWFLLFAISRINHSIVEKKQRERFLWTFFLILSLSSYTQVMLTASSASPDYITAIYIWLSFYILYTSSKSDLLSLILVILFSFFAVSIKLSALPIIITGLYAFIQLFSNKKNKAFFLSISITAIILTCVFARNIITSGYILYPTTFPDIVNSDWKVPSKKAQRERLYVTAFAKTESGASDQDIAFTINMKPKEWLPVWWYNRAPADKAILILAAISFLSALILFKKTNKEQAHIRICIITTLSGVTFWFLMAPDPRFGFGFLIGLTGLAATILIPPNLFTFISRKLIYSILLVLIASLVFYLSHRYKNYFISSQLVRAQGIKEEPASSINCEGIIFNMAAPYKGCGGNSVPCIEDSCKNFSLRGSNISDGFKPRSSTN
ncbi:MAG: hypothetical protein KF862_15495 [Chitinophagaceae bacterium]|nr:hypothetical protein [Chitinophagaceae bacterium]